MLTRTVLPLVAALAFAAYYALAYRNGLYSYVPGPLAVVDVALGLTFSWALLWRTRHPLGVAAAIGLASAVSSSVLVALIIALVGLAALRPWWQAAAVSVGTLAAGLPWFLLVPPESQRYSAIVVAVLLLLGCVGWGLAIGSRRRLVDRLREDVLRARADRDRRSAEARADERRRIAREMHDVLAHRMSLLSVHAGALAYRVRRAEQGQAPPPTGQELGDALGVIRENAHRALDELGGILEVLRSTDTDPGEGYADTTAPQPTLTDVARLIREATDSGQRVTARLNVPDTAPVGHVARTVYRVVQEGLTNARKHAPGARVEVCVEGTPGRGLTVSVRNPLPLGVVAGEIPGAGAGLTGLAERVALDGGTFVHGPEEGTFHLTAELPWSEVVSPGRPSGVGCPAAL
ncbi:histidine kinase [Nocardiopsis sp. N85]|uniref:histidine kinase n=1 Tax=Nocardiopsis sp. N85 TaxID=3029400 RepID=UPI00406C77CF